MAENLRFNAAGSDCYNNSVALCDTLGRFYSWEIALNGEQASSNKPSGVKGVCPAGWHIPSDAEWRELDNTVNKDYQYPNQHLKAIFSWKSNGPPTEGGTSRNSNGLDTYAFTAISTGYCWVNCEIISSDRGDVSFHWSADNGQGNGCTWEFDKSDNYSLWHSEQDQSDIMTPLRCLHN